MNHIKPEYAEPSGSGCHTKKGHGNTISTSAPENRRGDKTKQLQRWGKRCQKVLPMQRNAPSNRPNKNFAFNSPWTQAHPLPLMQLNVPPPLMGFVPNAVMPQVSHPELVMHVISEPETMKNVVSPPELDINDLYRKLSAAGILDSMNRIMKAKEAKPALNVPESLKKRQTSIISTLYSGTQCSNCGQRFPHDQTEIYNQHLDWHFQQNRRVRDARGHNSHQWYNKMDDWLQQGESEKANETTKCFFELQRARDESDRSGSASPQQPSCAAAPNEHNRACDVCNDAFDIFFEDNSEDWHLRNAIRVDGAVFHPDCYDDYLKTSE